MIMLRSSSWKARTRPYVCRHCQRHLHTASLKYRNSLRPVCDRYSKFSHSLSNHGISIEAPQSFSTSTTAYNTGGNGGPPESKAFPGSFTGGFGGGTLGGFARKPAATSGASRAKDVLLEHERQALEMRQQKDQATAQAQAPKATPSAPKPTTKPSIADMLRRTDTRSKSDGIATSPSQSQVNVRSAAELKQQMAQERDRREKERQNRASRLHTREKQDQNSKGRWGSFSHKKVTTPASEKPRVPKGVDSSLWTQIASSRRGEMPVENDDNNMSQETEDFWDELEKKVATNRRAQREVQRQTKPNDTHTNHKGQRENQSDGHDGYSGSAAKSRRKENSHEDVQTSQSSHRFVTFEEDTPSTSRKQDKKLKKKDRRSHRLEFAEEWKDPEADRLKRKKEKQAAKEQATQERFTSNAQVTPIFLPEYISVSSLATSLKQQQKQFLQDMEEMGFENITVDTVMTGETAAMIAMEYGFEPTIDDGATRDLRPRPMPEDVTSLPPRPPVVTIMGHVDHGKTTLLDWLRKSSVAAQEHGGITQHIGAFIVKMSSGKPITFLDTPGHAAFLTMRQRGANVTDIIVLVVAADDSVMPQTIEALKHARAAKVPIIVAINKIDKEDARINQVKADLVRHGVEIEDYGGDVQTVLVSGKTGQGMGDLEENIVTLSEILDVRAESDGLAEGWVLESSIKTDGKVGTVLVKRGTLRVGDVIVAGKSWARIRMLRNEAGVELSEAAPGTPVEILGWRELPSAGDQILQAPDEDKAKTAVDYRTEMEARQESGKQQAELDSKQREKAAQEAAAAAAKESGEEMEQPSEPGVTYQNFVVRSDVAGSAEAVSGALLELGNHEVQSRVLRASAGQVSEHDVDHASASNSIIVNFNQDVLPHIKQRAGDAKVRMLDYNVIYHLVDEAKAALSTLLAPNKITHVIGEADILQIFPINIKAKVFRNIAGCRVRNGSIKKNALVKVIRKGKVVFDGQMDTLKHVKKNVQEMSKGSECGIGLEGFEEFEVDDQIQCYEIHEEKRSL